MDKWQLDKLTRIEFSKKDISIWQDGSLVILDKEQVFELVELIEKHDKGELKHESTSETKLNGTTTFDGFERNE